MTDLSPSSLPLEQQLLARPDISHSSLLPNTHLMVADPPADDDSIIKCLCGFSEDDGNTVFCEDCHTWQHIECYYPKTDVPEVHQCVNCLPRQMDIKAAADRQRQSRTAPLTSERKHKRAPTKSTGKKKTKDAHTSSHANGTSQSERFSHDRASGSPHDPPPAKRPKTSHRTSSSTTSIIPPSQPITSKRRASSVVNAGASPTKSPSSPVVSQSPNERYSVEFMRLYDEEPPEVSSNTFSNLAISDELNNWLNDSEQFEKVANGKTQHDVFSRWDQPMEELIKMSPGVSRFRHEQMEITAHGRHPIIMGLTADSDAPVGAFLGELTGQITLRSDYEKTSDMWSTLQHPEPFVFFSDKLPVCIDARAGGSIFRYVRRSCFPNARMQIIIFGQEYRFCLVSEKPIQENEEITIGWFIHPRVMHVLKSTLEKKHVSSHDVDFKARWIANVLAHFGSCACNNPDDQCIFRLAQSTRVPVREVNGHAQKSLKRKGKKALSQVSPLSTGRATNSRAGSETRNHHEIDEDAVESRSASGSVRSKPSSRDITPMGPLHESVGLGVELSSREQRKIQEQERLFAKMNEEPSKKRAPKRNSGGSAINTAAVSTSKQLGHLEAFNPLPVPHMTNKTRQSGQAKPSRPSVSSDATAAKPASFRPAYTESATQTEGAGSSASENSINAAVVRSRRRQGVSLTHRLLRRSKIISDRASRAASMMSSTISSTPSVTVTAEQISAMRLDAQSRDMPPPPLPAHVSKLLDTADRPIQNPTDDIVMTDASPTEADEVAVSEAATSQEGQAPQINSDSTTKSGSAEQTSLLTTTTEPVPALQSPVTSPQESTQSTQTPSTNGSSLSAPHLKPNLKVDLPPVPPFEEEKSKEPSVTPTTPSVNVVSPSGECSTAEKAVGTEKVGELSPSAPASAVALSPSLTNAPTNTPAKKKLSLSDYRNRKKMEAAQQAALNSPMATSTPLLTVKHDTLESKIGTDEPISVMAVSSETDKADKSSTSESRPQECVKAGTEPEKDAAEPKAGDAMNVDPKPEAQPTVFSLPAEATAME